MKRGKIFLAIFAVALAAGAGYWYVTHRPARKLSPSQENHLVQITRPVTRGNEVVLQPETRRIPPGGEPIQHTLNALFATAQEGSGPSAFPTGTRLLNLRIENGLATLNLSAEFRALNRQGDTSESLAQNALRKALAQFPQVKRMTVLVEGQLYEGEHSGEWVDIPVRDVSTHNGDAP